MDKKELLKQVDDIYAIVSTLNASGDAIDTLAAARSKLRKLRAYIDKAEKEVPDGGQNNG